MGIRLRRFRLATTPTIEQYVEQTGIDGFLLEPHLVPGTYDDFINLLLPVLRDRGLARTDYAGWTLRETLFGPGSRWLADDHPGARYRAGAETAHNFRPGDQTLGTASSTRCRSSVPRL